MKFRFLLLLTLLPLFARAAAPVAGVDYVEIPGGQPYAPLKGKVEVAEVFGYTCIHCAKFQPLLNEWKKRQPAYVRLTPVPAAFGGFWNTYARAYFAAEKLGVLAKSHDAVFKAVHTENRLPFQNPSAGEIAAFYTAYGADAKAFAAAMESPAADAQLEQAKRFAAASGIEGTPTLVVNGKYRVIGRSFEDALKTTDFLVVKERGGKK